MQETLKDLLADLRLREGEYGGLRAFVNGEHKYIHDLRINLINTLQAGIKMTIMARPVLGKVFFELLFLVVSAVNGCVNNHEKSVRHEGGTQEFIFDAIRLGAVAKGLCVAFHEAPHSR